MIRRGVGGCCGMLAMTRGFGPSLGVAYRFSTQLHETTIRLQIPTEEDMQDIGGLLAATLLTTTLGDPISSRHPAAGSVLFLQGDLGAGKTTFSRGFVRAATGVEELRVTSPTYLLSNSYPVASDPTLELYHLDLYRLSGTTVAEFAPLNLEHVFYNCVSLVEWPTRLPKALVPTERLDVTITMDNRKDDINSERRYLTLQAHQSVQWQEHLEMLRREGYLDDLMV